MVTITEIAEDYTFDNGDGIGESETPFGNILLTLVVWVTVQKGEDHIHHTKEQDTIVKIEDPLESKSWLLSPLNLVLET